MIGSVRVREGSTQFCVVFMCCDFVALSLFFTIYSTGNGPSAQC
jgi:hypothetical protein